MSTEKRLEIMKTLVKKESKKKKKKKKKGKSSVKGAKEYQSYKHYEAASNIMKNMTKVLASATRPEQLLQLKEAIEINPILTKVDKMHLLFEVEMAFTRLERKGTIKPDFRERQAKYGRYWGPIW